MSQQTCTLKDQQCQLARSAAAQMLQTGEIRSYHLSRCGERGRMIHVESDQGWDPDPMYQEYPELGYTSPAP